jgi:uncharacterized protein
MDQMQAAAILAAVFCGAAAQGLTGLGFGLVAAPLLVLCAGPLTGVCLGNALAVVLAATILTRTWRTVRWRQAAVLVPGGVGGTLLGALVLGRVPQRLLFLLLGALVLVAVSLVAGGLRTRLLAGRTGAIGAGLASGFMNVTAGVGGPLLAVHSITEGWTTEAFVGTAQLYFLVTNSSSLLLKGLPAVQAWLWLSLLAALTGGAVTGRLASRLVPAPAARRVVIAVALAGGLATMLRGLLPA